MSGERVERRLAAIIAADVAGYSRLMGADEAGTFARLKTLRRELIDPAVADHKGRLVKTTGDGLLIEFPSVVEAVACAVTVQRDMAKRNADVPEGSRIEFRIGINLGDMIVEDGDIHGDGVMSRRGWGRSPTRAASSTSRRSCMTRCGAGSIALRGSGEQTLKNIARPVRVYRVRLGAGARPSRAHAGGTGRPRSDLRPRRFPTSRRSRCCRSRT